MAKKLTISALVANLNDETEWKSLSPSAYRDQFHQLCSELNFHGLIPFDIYPLLVALLSERLVNLANQLEPRERATTLALYHLTLDHLSQCTTAAMSQFFSLRLHPNS